MCRTLPIWIWDGIRLFCFVLVLAPGFMRFFWYYAITAKRKSMRYGQDSCRQTLDIYCLEDTQANTDDEASTELVGRPVVIFYTGGAWIIGYKMWGTLLARALTAAGVLVVLQWIHQNIANYGGDPEKIVVVGQSAGGHLSCIMLLKKAIENRTDGALPVATLPAPTLSDVSPDVENPMNGALPATTSFVSPDDDKIQPSAIKGYISLSAPFCLQGMQESFTRHGLDDHLVDRIFGGEVYAYSPQRLVEHSREEGHYLSDLLPPIRIYHGTLDKTVPHDDSKEFTRQLQNVNADAIFTSYKGWSHTDAILEGPMDSDHRFHKDIFLVVQEWTDSPNLVWPEDDPIITKRLCPHFLISLGRFCNPF
jgi:prenylcysteine alpha-carboxyl methylesterase